MSHAPVVTQRYTLTATGQGGERTAHVRVEVIPEPVITALAAVPDEILLGGASTLSLQSTNPT